MVQLLTIRRRKLGLWAQIWKNKMIQGYKSSKIMYINLMIRNETRRVYSMNKPS